MDVLILVVVLIVDMVFVGALIVDILEARRRPDPDDPDLVWVPGVRDGPP